MRKIFFGQSDFAGDGQYAGILAGRFERRGQRVRRIVGAPQAQLRGGQQTPRIKIVRGCFDHLVEMRFGGLQIAQCVFDQTAQQQRGHEFGCGFQHGCQVVARGFGLLFAEVDQRLGVARLQIVGGDAQGGADFLARFGQLAVGDGDPRQGQPGAGMPGSDPDGFAIDRDGFGGFPGGAQQVALQQQAFVVRGVEPQSLVKILHRLAGVAVGQCQLRQRQMDLGIVACGLQRALQRLARVFPVSQADCGGGA